MDWIFSWYCFQSLAVVEATRYNTCMSVAMCTYVRVYVYMYVHVCISDVVMHAVRSAVTPTYFVIPLSDR